MLKGNVCIELQDVNTGETEKIEHHNLVTKGAEEMLRYAIRGGFFGNLVPLATKMYGGLFLFDSALTASVTNTTLSTNSHLVGLADDSATGSDAHRGSYNTLESGKTSRGYKHIWDFNTSQCNGTIGALSLVPLKHASSTGSTDYRMARDTRTYKACYYDEDANYLYSAEFANNTTNLNIRKVHYPITKIGLNDPANMNVANWEDVGTITLTHGGTSFYPFRQDTIGIIQSSPWQTPTQFDIAFIDLATLNVTYNTVLVSSLNLPSGFTVCARYNTAKATVSGDYLYIGTLNETTHENGVCIWNLNTSQVVGHYVVYTASDNQLNDILPYELGIVKLVHPSKTSFVYSDGRSIPYYTGQAIDYAISKNIVCVWDTQYEANELYPSYKLNTIFNLPSPIVKTASQTMKVTYTLTEDEEE